MITDIHQEILKSYREFKDKRVLRINATQLKTWSEKETWIPVVNYEGFYEVSSFGRVKNCRTGRILKQGMTGKGYPGVRLYKNRLGSQRVHNLVMEAFVGSKKKGMEVNHLDMNKENNRIDNLEYISHQENITHCWASGKMKPKKGSDNWRAKLVESQVKEILLVKKFHGRNRQLARKYHVDDCTIIDIYKGRTWRHVSGLPPWR